MSKTQSWNPSEDFSERESGRADIKLTILLTVVSGKESVCRCLNAICPQLDFDNSEVLVPYDVWSMEVAELSADFPDVSFHFIEDLGLAASARVSSFQHRLYDRRRAVGLHLARGEIIAMTEDHATPADDWCRKIIALQEQSYDVIGGAVENKVDRPLNWAWYYCDFGRYGRPLEGSESSYISDINIAYKRGAIMSVREFWKDAYHETSVNWELAKMGMKLHLDEQMVVYQERPQMSLYHAFKERISWGRVFAETRSSEFRMIRRIAYGVGSVLLPPILLRRAVHHMRRQNQPISKITAILPYIVLLVAGWAIGESFGYIKGTPNSIEISDGRTWFQESD